MATLRTTKNTSDIKRKRPSRGEIEFISIRNQHNAHNLILKSLKNSGISQKELSEITGIDEGSISRVVSFPRNVELNTLSKIVFALSGAAISFTLEFPGMRTATLLLSVSQKSYETSSRTSVLNDTKLRPIFSDPVSANTEGQVREIVDARGK